jgi:hypothetical protein
MVIPFENKEDLTLIKQNIEAEIQNDRPDCYCVITFDRA